MKGAIILIAIGVIFLLGNLGFDADLGQLWPFFLILIGLLQLPKALLGNWGALTGGLTMIMLGSLFAVQTVFGIGFERTWPLLLLFFGLLALLKAVFRPLFFPGRVARFMRGGFRL